MDLALVVRTQRVLPLPRLTHLFGGGCSELAQRSIARAQLPQKLWARGAQSALAMLKLSCKAHVFAQSFLVRRLVNRSSVPLAVFCSLPAGAKMLSSRV